MKKLFLLLLASLVLVLPVHAQGSPPTVTVAIDCLTSRFTVNVILNNDGLNYVARVDDASGATVFTTPAFTNGIGTQTFGPNGGIGTYTVLLSPAGSGIFTPVSSASPDCSIQDGRLPINNNDLVAPVALFCAAGGQLVGVGIDWQGRSTQGWRASALQIANAIAEAQVTGQNVQVASAPGGLGLWVLTTGELQATRRYGGALDYNYIFASNTCGVLPAAAPYVALGTPTPAPYVLGGAPISMAPMTRACTQPTGTRALVVVQRGDNLFRIALRYGTTFTALATYNGIANPARISVGQCIVLP